MATNEIPIPLGGFETHAQLLRVPDEEQQLFKVMSVDNLLRSIEGSYLHFNRVDSYPDGPSADPHDGEQLRMDRAGNQVARFEKAPNFSAADYYDQARSRTYACCFSLENSPHIWQAYGNGGTKGKVAIVTTFAKLRKRLRDTFESADVALEYGGVRLKPIFHWNFGLVDYIDRDQHQANHKRLVNPIQYAYLKSSKFAGDSELRVTLSALGIGQFALGGEILEFPPRARLHFDFRSAIDDGALVRLEIPNGSDTEYLYGQLDKLRVTPLQR